MIVVFLAAAAAGGWFLRERKKRWVQGCLAAVLVLCGNAAYHRVESGNVTGVEPPQAIAGRGVEPEHPVQLSGVLVSTVEVDGDRAVFYLEADEWAWDGQPAALSKKEKVYVTVRLLLQEEQAVAAGWRRGDRLRLSGTAKQPDGAGNFGGFDFREYLRRQKVHWTVSAKGTSSAEVRKPGRWRADTVLRWNDLLRESAGKRLDRLFPNGDAGYMKGLLIGIREDLDPERFRDFSRLGLTHILAISGLHVAVFAWAVTALLRRFRATREASRKALLWTIPFYILFTGASPSVVRAGLTAIAGLYAAGKGWLKDGLSLLGAAALFMLAANPYSVLDVGFQLSFVVTAGLIAAVPVFGRLLPVRNRLLNGSLSVALTSQLVSFPLTVYYFNQFSVLSLPANLILVPVISFVVTPLGYAALLISFVLPGVGMLAAKPAAWINQAVFRCVETLDGITWGRFIWPSPSIWWIAAYYVLLACCLHKAWRRMQLAKLERDRLYLTVHAAHLLRRWGWTIACSMMLLAGLGLYGYSPSFLQGNGKGAAAFLDVGQGDSAYIRTPGGKHLLIDGGGTPVFRKAGEEWKERQDPYEVGRKTLVPLLKKRGVHKLDYIVISHEDADHIGGLAAVLEEIPAGAILFNGTLKSSPAADKLFRLALTLRIPLIPAAEGDVFRLDGRTSLTVLNPPATPDRSKIIRAEEQNDQTLVALLDMNGVRFLFAGDLGSGQEKELLRRLELNGQLAPAAAGGLDVLKVGHHGSKNSSSSDWLSFWSPKLSVISAGRRNLYGHPHAAALERLEEAGTLVYRTDMQGEIQMETGPKGELRVRTKRMLEK